MARMSGLAQWDSWCQSLEQQHDLSTADSEAAIQAVMNGQVPDEQLGRFLLALRAKGETAAELAGAARALRTFMRRIQVSQPIFIDTCGTGGDGARTFNISTAAAIVTAATGVPVAKHGNRSITSKSGSADVLTALGVNIQTELPVVERCLQEIGLGFCFAPLYHPAMKRVAEVRRALGVPTIFNLLGPLSNPAGAPCQLLGVGKPALRPLLAQALQLLSTTRSAVVSGADGLDEVTIATETHVSLVTPTGIEELRWTPEQFGLPRAELTSLLIDGPEQSAALIREILQGKSGPARDIVVLNAAAAIWLAQPERTTLDAAQLAQQAIDSGTAQELLQQLIRITQTPA
jgi:anthranilate phosphoribosyltransferase